MKEPQPGDRIDDFTVVYKISTGMNTDVLAVWHHSLLVPLICKRLRSENALRPKWIELLNREGKALSEMKHPGIVRLIEWNSEAESPYLLLEHVGGKTLRDLLKEQVAFKTDHAVRIVQHLAAAVSHIHSKGYLHRDLKPSNVILRDNRPVLLDFGVVWRINPERNPPDRSGTPQYLSPEQIKLGKLSPATDVYGLGMLLYELLGGERPFRKGALGTESDLLEEIYPQLVEPPKQLEETGSGINPKLAAIIYRCLDRQPENRLQRAVDLIRALDEFTVIKIWKTEAVDFNPFD